MIVLMFHVRDIKNGKGEKMVFYHLYKWLLDNMDDLSYKLL